MLEDETREPLVDAALTPVTAACDGLLLEAPSIVGEEEVGAFAEFWALELRAREGKENRLSEGALEAID